MTGGAEKRRGDFWRVVNNRLGTSRLAYHVPEHGNALPYMLGGLALGCFVILVVTGIFLAQFYNPSPDGAHQSIVYTMTNVPFGDFLRNLHYWAANFFIIILLLHLIRVFLSGSYKKPRELTWLTGLILLALSFGFFFTGTVLKQDQEAVEALAHNIGAGELFGKMGAWFTPGFTESVSIVTRIFSAHITILVFLFLAVLALHLYLIKLHGISPKPTIDAVSRSTEGEGKSYFTVHLKKLFGYNVLLLALLGIFAAAFPAPLGAPGVSGMEITKPPWLFLPFYGMEDTLGFPAIAWGPLTIFILLALVPFIDRNPYMFPRRRKPAMVYGAVILLILVGFGAEAYFRKVDVSAGHMQAGGTSPTLPSDVLDIAHRADNVPPPITRKNFERVVFDLETKEVVAELAPGITYEYWTYNGTLPGPFLRVREGDTVEIRLTHALHGHADVAHGVDTLSLLALPTAFAHGGEEAVPDAHETTDRDDHEMTGTDEHAAAGHGTHSIDLHAVIGPGGGATLTQTKSGETNIFQFKATRPGLYVYHCASPHIPTHVANGMYGLILVEPAGGMSAVDREFYVMQGELYTKGSLNEGGFQELSKEKLLAERPEYVVFNGRVGALTGEHALRAKTGEKIRLFVGVGTFLPSNFHVIGGVLDYLYPEGDILSPPHRNVQTTLIPAGGATVVEFTLDVPGKYLLVDHSLTRAIDRGALGELIVEGMPRPDLLRGIP